jgi:hypothetical protein
VQSSRLSSPMSLALTSEFQSSNFLACIFNEFFVQLPISVPR